MQPRLAGTASGAVVGRIYADRRPGKSKNVVNVKPGDWKIIDYL